MAEHGLVCKDGMDHQSQEVLRAATVALGFVAAGLGVQAAPSA